MRFGGFGEKGLSSLLLAAALTAASACVPAGRIYVRLGPPPPRIEARIRAPGPDFVWVGGYYRWDGRAYVWEPGRWMRPPRPRARWEPGRWEHDRRGWFWVEGHWR